MKENKEIVSEYSALTSSNNSLAASLAKDAKTYDVKRVERNENSKKTLISLYPINPKNTKQNIITKGLYDEDW